MKIALSIAGSDSGGGAGLQADLKTFHQFGVFGTTVVTAVTAQNTREVRAWHAVAPDLVLAQLDALLDDLPPDAVKSGMLGSREVIVALADRFASLRPLHYVLDPVIVASAGARLAAPDAEQLMVERLVPLAELVTPNIPEAQALSGIEIHTADDMVAAGAALVRCGAGAALVTGGHLSGDELVDVLVTPRDTVRFAHPRIPTTSTHGTGCTLSAAVTAGLALGKPLPVAVRNAVDFVQRALANPPRLGVKGGHGPLDHTVRPGN